MLRHGLCQLEWERLTYAFELHQLEFVMAVIAPLAFHSPAIAIAAIIFQSIDKITIIIFGLRVRITYCVSSDLSNLSISLTSTYQYTIPSPFSSSDSFAQLIAHQKTLDSVQATYRHRHNHSRQLLIKEIHTEFRYLPWSSQQWPKHQYK